MDYRDRVTADLDRWIADGLVAPDKREAIVATLPARRTLDAVTALIWVAGVLLGLAVVAFIAANWDGIPRLARFALILGAFLAAAFGGAEASRRGRALVSDVLLTLSTVIFAAAIGLTGQIFEFAGNPPAVPYGTGAAALALGLVGASRGALAVGVIGVLIGDLMVTESALPIPISAVVAPFVLILALRWRAPFLAHVASIGVLGAVLWLVTRYDLKSWALLGVAVSLAAVGAALAVSSARRPEGSGSVDALIRIPATWFILGGLGFFIAAGYLHGVRGNTALGLLHRVAWIAASAGLIAFGRFDRQAVLTGIGVVSLIAASCGLLYDLGLNLLVISLVFLGCSLVALIVGLVLRRGRDTNPVAVGESEGAL